MVIYPYQTSAEGEDFAEGDEHAVVDLTHWRAEEPTCKQYASEYAQTDC